MTINFNSLNSLSAFGKEVIKVFLNDEIIWQKDTPLCFTAKEPNVKITFDANGNWPTDYNYLEYSTDGNNWDDYTGQEITLASTGDKVYFNTPDDITNHTWGNVYPFSFTSNGQYAASGNIMSLVVKDGKTDRIPEDFYF